jgi:hypothetical protein
MLFFSFSLFFKLSMPYLSAPSGMTGKMQKYFLILDVAIVRNEKCVP